eukprot:1141535-Pelagomonas_calceolata.AAC.8
MGPQEAKRAMGPLDIAQRASRAIEHSPRARGHWTQPKSKGATERSPRARGPMDIAQEQGGRWT